MNPRISMITLGVSNIQHSVAFYQHGLGLPRLGFPSDQVAFFTLNGSWLGLFGESELATDAGIQQAQQAQNYRGVTLAHNLPNRDDVDALMQQAQNAGATITKPAQETFWGGYSGYFADPDNHLWEIAHNPFMWIGPANHKQQATLVANWQGAANLPATTLTGSYCQLEPLDAASHAKPLYESFNRHRQLWDYLPYGPFASSNEYASFISDKTAADDPVWFAVCVDDKAIGVATQMRINPAAGTAEIGHLCFSPQLQCTRSATEAIYMLAKRIFDCGYRRLEWKCNSLNRRSRNAALRFGFSFEGIFRNAQVVKDYNRDSAWYSITSEDWEMLKPIYQQWLKPDNFDQKGIANISLSTLTRPVIQFFG